MNGETIKTDLRLLDPKQVTLRADSFGRLHLEVGIEERYGPVQALRCLPITQPERFISLQDDEGEEIGIIADLSALDKRSRRALEEELERYYLKARIESIRKVEARNGIITWDVETNLGPKLVHVRDRQNIRPLADGRIILTDIHDGKFEIPPPEELDDRSRSWLMIES